MKTDLRYGQIGYERFLGLTERRVVMYVGRDRVIMIKTASHETDGSLVPGDLTYVLTRTDWEEDDDGKDLR